VVGFPYIMKLEIWGRAQREAARCCKSDWGDSLLSLGKGGIKKKKFRSKQRHNESVN